MEAKLKRELRMKKMKIVMWRKMKAIGKISDYRQRDRKNPGWVRVDFDHSVNNQVSIEIEWMKKQMKKWLHFSMQDLKIKDTDCKVSRNNAIYYIKNFKQWLCLFYINSIAIFWF
ncbi:unnamed protein product [Blepharisma stoltei]|uniref:Uncharacterized protein n=1 Tax=Blepharisma stoltei TaxID=1481888 RepID=A0AAU9JTW1_9CILI|nr:unnamed protein product [Blepharisma stoltei]